MSNGDGSEFRFEGWTLRPAQRQLLVRGARAAIGSRAFDVLCMLVQRHGQVVTKEELLLAAWRGVVVEENNISVQIAALRKLLGAQAITTVAGRGYQLSAEHLRESVNPKTELPAPKNNHPGADSALELLGRQQDLRAVLERLAELNLVTLTGPGGVGKTALAHEAYARRCALLQRSGVWIDLAPVRDQQRLLTMLAQALDVDLPPGAEQMGTLLAALRQAEGLVVLDNCEHLQAALAPFLQRALTELAGLRWLATSQMPLHVAGESVYRLDPLSVPSGGGLTPGQAIEHGAVALLCKRVADADRRFRLNDSNVNAVVALCHCLDGLPLAIEMAAARVAAIGIDAVQGLLGQRLRLSATIGRNFGYRHATLRDTYEWSCGLLHAHEQAVFRRLEPFLGGFVTELAQEVARDDDEGGSIGPWEVLDALSTLVEKSLVQRGSEGSGRFFLLESARDHARACLHANGELNRVHARHARALAQLVSSAEADAASMHDAAWVSRYGPEVYNMRTALEHCKAHGEADDLARLVTALAMVDWMLCRQADILQDDIPMDLLAGAAPRLRAEAYLELSWALFSDGDHQLGAQLAQRAHVLFVELGNPALAYRALAQWTRLLETLPGMEEHAQRAWQELLNSQPANLPRRIRLFCAISGGLVNRDEVLAERLEALGREAEHEGFDAIAAIAACNRTDILLAAGRNEEVVCATERAVDRHAYAHRACACMLLNRTTALIRLGRYDQALTSAQRALRLMPAVAPALVDAFALAAACSQRMADAAVLHGCGNQIRQHLSHAPDRAEATTICETVHRLKAALSPDHMQELMALGAAMSPPEALAIKVFSRTELPTDASAGVPEGLWSSSDESRAS